MDFSNRKLNWRVIRPAILSGVLIGTSYIPFPPWALAFGFVPLWASLRSCTNWKSVFALSWITTFILTLIGFNWIAYTSVEFGHLPAALGPLVLAGFAAFAHLHLVLAPLAWHLLRQRFPVSSRLADYIRLAGLSMFFETFFPMIFPWNMGYSWLWIQAPLVQWADMIGFQGLSGLTFVANAILTEVWLRKSEKASFQRLALGLGLAFVLLNLTGEFRKRTWPEPDASLRALAIQGNIGNYEKFLAERVPDVRIPIVKTYLELTRKGVENQGPVDVVFWPETAFPDYLDEFAFNGYHQKQIRILMKELQTPLIAGGYSGDPRSNRVYNAIFHIDKEGELKGSYRKTILLAFGEYFPGAKYFPFLKKLVPEISDFERGSGTTVFDSPMGRFGLQICYEGLFPDFSAQLARQGAQFFLNVTNDSWFGWWMEPYQHLIMTAARSIEMRRPLIRVTNTGFSTFSDHLGQMGERSRLNEAQTLRFDVPYFKNPEVTFYSQWEWVFPWIFLASAAMVTIFNRKRKSS